MDYKTGTHIIVAKKSFSCEHCKQAIQPGESYMMRRIVIILDIQNDDKRYHFDCALGLADLTDEERNKILNTRQNNTKQETLFETIKKKLTSYEYQGRLTFFLCNAQAPVSKNFIVLLEKSRKFILSVTSNNEQVASWLQRKFDFVKKDDGYVHNISTVEEFEAVLESYTNNNQ